MLVRFVWLIFRFKYIRCTVAVFVRMHLGALHRVFFVCIKNFQNKEKRYTVCTPQCNAVMYTLS